LISTFNNHRPRKNRARAVLSGTPCLRFGVHLRCSLCLRLLTTLPNGGLQRAPGQNVHPVSEIGGRTTSQKTTRRRLPGGQKGHCLALTHTVTQGQSRPHQGRCMSMSCKVRPGRCTRHTASPRLVPDHYPFCLASFILCLSFSFHLSCLFDPLDAIQVVNGKLYSDTVARRSRTRTLLTVLYGSYLLLISL